MTVLCNASHHSPDSSRHRVLYENKLSHFILKASWSPRQSELTHLKEPHNFRSILSHNYDVITKIFMTSSHHSKCIGLNLMCNTHTIHTAVSCKKRKKNNWQHTAAFAHRLVSVCVLKRSPAVTCSVWCMPLSAGSLMNAGSVAAGRLLTAKLAATCCCLRACVRVCACSWVCVCVRVCLGGKFSSLWLVR